MARSSSASQEHLGLSGLLYCHSHGHENEWLYITLVYTSAKSASFFWDIQYICFPCVYPLIPRRHWTLLIASSDIQTGLLKQRSILDHSLQISQHFCLSSLSCLRIRPIRWRSGKMSSRRSVARLELPAVPWSCRISFGDPWPRCLGFPGERRDDRFMHPFSKGGSQPSENCNAKDILPTFGWTKNHPKTYLLWSAMERLSIKYL